MILLQTLMLMLFETFWTLLGGGPDAALYPPADKNPTRTVYVVSNGFHVGLVVAMADLPGDLIPEQAGFAGYRYLETGWGEREFYQAERVTLAMTLSAALRPTPSVMHLAAFNEPVDSHYRDYEHIRLELSEEGFRRMCQFMDDQFERGGQPAAMAMLPGLYDFSFFYPARDIYDWRQSCNVWTARALRRAGCPVITSLSITAGSLMTQVKWIAGADTSGKILPD